MLLVSALCAQFDINNITKLQKTIELDKDLKYEYFATDGEYFCWSEFYTSTISCLNIETDSIEKIRLKKGRGPNEFIMIFGMSIVEGVLYLNDTNNLKLIRVDIESMSFLSDVSIKERVHYLFGESQKLYGVKVNPGFSKVKSSYLFSVDIEADVLKPIKWTAMIKTPETTQDNFSGYYRINDRYFVRVGSRKNHLVVADFKNEELSQHLLDEPFQNQLANKTSSGSQSQALNFYIHDAVIGEKNKLYLLAEGRTKIKKFQKNELSIFNLETMEYMEEAVNLPKEFDNIMLTDKYLFGFSKKEPSITYYTYN